MSARIARRGSCSWFCNSVVDMANIRTRTPGRPSGVSRGSTSPSMPASTPQPMTEVAKPVNVTAAWRAHLRLSAR